MKSGSSEFDEWYRQTWPGLVRAITAVLGDRGTAEDIASTTCFKAFERWSRLDHPTAWAYRVAVNLAGRHRRLKLRVGPLERHRRQAGIPDIDPELWRGGWSSSSSAGSDRTSLRGGMSEAQIADAMDIAPGTVAATSASARNSLRDTLESDSIGAQR